MRIIINKNRLKERPDQIMRRAGYGYIESYHTGKESFVRRFTRDHYPRFHLYLEAEGGNTVFNLHLDQKKASYKGAHAHNAEYGGEIVRKEAERLKEFIIGFADKVDDTRESRPEKTAAKVGYGKIKDKERKKGFWERIFS